MTGMGNAPTFPGISLDPPDLAPGLRCFYRSCPQSLPGTSPKQPSVQSVPPVMAGFFPSPVLDDICPYRHTSNGHLVTWTAVCSLLLP